MQPKQTKSKQDHIKKVSNSFFIITGGPGSGKTTLIEELKRRGVFCVEEVARKTIQDEVASGGDALPWKNLERYIETLIVRSIASYKEALSHGQEPVVFDTGVFDYIGYASRTKTPVLQELHSEASRLCYNKKVFIAPPWEEIYCNDSERKQSFEEALEVYRNSIEVYSKYGYVIIFLPKISVEGRADFVMSHIQL